MKIVFLDVDGVLNSGKNYKAYDTARKADGDSWSDMTSRHIDLLFDKENVDCLNQITDASEAAIVVSSSWRKLCEWGNLVSILKRVGVKAEVIDKTPVLATKFSQVVERGLEIHNWLEENVSRNVDSFVILDDDDDMAHLKKRHVMTDGRKGLSSEDVERALRILSDLTSPSSDG